MVTIYIVEDELLVRKGLCNTLDGVTMGAEIIGSAKDGKEGLDGILSLKPDIVLTDLMMPRMGGIEMIQELRKKGWEGEVVFFSGYQDVDLLKKAFKLQVIDYIFKPITNEELISVCRTAIRRVGEKQERTAITHTKWEFDADPQLFNKIKDEIRQDLKNISIAILAEKLKISRSTLERSFKNTTGEALTDHIAKIRIQAACGYLRNTSLKINEIAVQVGYQDIRYFSRNFKNVMGMLPVEYRENNRSEEKR